MTEQTNRIKWLQYINTGILTAILAFVGLNFTVLGNLQKDNLEAQKELLRIKTIQDYNSASIKELQAKIGAIEQYQAEMIKSWVDLNYIRKPQ